MSAKEIIAELSHLEPGDLSLVKSKPDEVLERRSGLPKSAVEFNLLLRLAGAAHGLPPDLAENHDFYLYGAPKRSGG